MAENQGRDAINLLLSREELLVVLNLLRVTTIPGVEDDPAGEWSEAERAVALRTAERALQARQLLWSQTDGQLSLHNDLLAAVGTCAYADRALFVYHWGEGQELPTPSFIHLRGAEIVVHTRPSDVLHLFTRLASQTQLTDFLVTTTQFTETPNGTAEQWQMPGALFVEVRRLVDSGATTAAVDLVARQAGGRAQAQALVDTLANGLRATNLQLRSRQPTGVAQQDYLLLQNPQHTWLVTPSNNGGSMVIRPAGQQDLASLLSAAIA